MSRYVVVMSAVVLTSLPLAGVRAEVEYELFIIKPFRVGGPTEAYAWDVNSAGTAVGMASAETYHGYFWTPETDKIDVGVGDLRGINNHGTAVGGGSMWTDPQTVTPIPAPDGYYVSVHALGISDTGIVVGEAVHRYHSNWSDQVAIVWDARGGTRILSALGVPSAFTANRVNSLGQIVGETSIARSFDSTRAYFFDLNTREYRDLGTFMPENAGSAVARDINDAGVVVGAATYPDIFGQTHAYRWTHDSGLEDLGVLGVYRAPWGPHELSRANGVNAAGVIVGTSTVNDNKTSWDSTHAFVWDATRGMRDLNKLADIPDGYYLLEAKAVSDSGWIVGTGFGSPGESFYSGFALRPIGGGACGDSSRLSIKCKAGGSKVKATLARADAQVEVTFRLDGGADVPTTTSTKGKAVASWKKQPRGDHQVTVCDLVAACP